jgi:L-asparaginase II
MIAAVLARLLGKDPALSAAFAEMAAPTLTNWNGIDVGALRPIGELALQPT